MSPDPTDYVHPNSLSDEQKAEMRAADPAAFDDDEGDANAAAGEKTAEELAAEAAAAGKTDEGKTEPTEEEKAAAAAAAAGTGAELTDEQKAAAAAGVAAGKTTEEIAAELAAGGDKVDKKAFDGVLADLRATRDEVKELKAFKNTISQAPAAPKDFDAEFKSIQKQYDDGDLTLDERLAAERALGREEAQYTALVTVHQANNANALTAAENDWTQQVNAWSKENAEFLSNPIRKDAVGRLMDQLGADASLSNEALLEKVQAAAFEAFNWKPEPVKATDKENGKGGDGKDPHADRRAANAAATAAASAVPGNLNGGVGGRGGPEKVVDLDNVKPGTFSKNLTEEQQEKLLGEGAL